MKKRIPLDDSLSPSGTVFASLWFSPGSNFGGGFPDSKFIFRYASDCLKIVSLALAAALFTGCGGVGKPGNMGGPTAEIRKQQIATEPTGDFYYGRRYFIKYTRFWGYLRKPGEPAKNAQLVIFNESRKLAPDRLPENGPPGQRYGFDQNYEYRIRGYYSGRQLYENISNQVLPEFQLLGYEVIDKKPGWLFRPNDVYQPESFTLTPR